MALKRATITKESQDEIIKAVVHLIEKVKTISTIEAMNAVTAMEAEDDKDMFVFMQDYLFVKILAYAIQLTLNYAYMAQKLTNDALIQAISEETGDNQP